MLPLFLGIAGTSGIIFIFLRYFWPGLVLDWIYIRARKRILDFVAKHMEAKNFLIDVFEDKVSENPSKTFLIFEDKKYSYAEVDTMANKVARAALEIGLKPGDNVAVLLYNEPVFVWTYLGLLKAGLRIVFINYNLRSRSLAHCINCSETNYLIVGEELILTEKGSKMKVTKLLPITVYQFFLKGEALIDAVQEVLPEIPSVLVYLYGHTSDLKSPSFNSFGNVIDRVPDGPIDKAVRDHLTYEMPGIFIFTSGTTGLPKPAIIDQAKLLWSASSWNSFGMTEDDVVYETLPMYHSAALMVGFGNTVTKGATIVLRSKFSASHFWEDCRKHHVTIFQYIGEICRYLVARPKDKMDGVHKIKYAYGNGLRQDIWAEFQERFKIPQIVEFYGATESPLLFLNVTNKLGACGRSSPMTRKYLPATFVKFDLESQSPARNKSGRCIPIQPGEVGLLLCPLTPQGRQFRGYLGRKEATEKKILRDVFQEGDKYFDTGDLLKLDKDYYVYFNDRVGDTFRWKGENVSTTEVSNVITDLDFVHDANVYGVTVPGGDGRAGMVSLHLSDNEVGFLNQAQMEIISKHVNKLLPFYARPRFLRVQKEFSMTSTFKQQKMSLVQEGFDVVKITDPIYFYNPATQEYKPLDYVTYLQIMAGKVPL